VLTIGLALAAAAMYGLSDFFGGLVSRRASVWQVATVTQIAAVVLVGTAALVIGGSPTTAEWLWGALAGIGTGSGTAFLYRGLSSGRMSVVAPLSAVGAALVPVAVGVLTGDRPPPITWIGIACAIPAIWLVSTSPDPSTSQPERRGRIDPGVVDGVLAGLGFGLMFAALGQVPDSAGLGPLAAAEVSSIAAIAVVAVAFGASWVPREREAWWGLIVGALAAVAAIMFLVASQMGMLTVAAVLSSLYPVFTVLLAALVLRERIAPVQAVGLVLALAAVVLVAVG
jgi:drug/metabolite transporter (DMT)-like permease